MAWCPCVAAFIVVGGFLAYTPDIPQELLDNSVAHSTNYTLQNFVGHFELVHHQLREVSRSSGFSGPLFSPVQDMYEGCTSDRPESGDATPVIRGRVLHGLD